VLTDQGAAALAQAVAEWMAEAVIAVGDGTTQASTSLSQPPEVRGSVVVLRGEFGEDEANFDWTVQRVIVNHVLVDETQEDLGRKAGGVMPLTIEIDVAPAE
jgi:hypothetical protein